MRDATRSGLVDWWLDDVQRLAEAGLLSTWNGKPAKTKLGAQHIAQSSALTRDGSPYPLSNILFIERKATLSLRCI